jgi:serine/threonine protein kinase
MASVKRIKGRYEIKAKLGEGGMGIVYRAYDPPPMKRDVALKTLPAFPDRTALQLFYKECEVLKSMSHPNIVEIFDMGEFDEEGQKKPFFVMPLLPGQTLDEIIRNTSHRLTVDRVVDIISQTCRGLQAAHERGLIHRDLKPSNIFVMQDDSVKIIDFGVAHTVDSHSRSSGFQKGTLLYMAPEQIQYKPVSAQSDIFSLGVVCYEALTRRQPFRGNSEEEIIDAILKQIPPPASEINSAVSQTISRVVHKAMAKQAWHRFGSAREFSDTLQKALRNEPIELFDPSRIQPRVQRANKAFEGGDYQFAAEIVGELEAEGNMDPAISLLRTHIEQAVRQKTIAQLLESARARYEEEEDPLALQKIQEILQLDPNHAAALGLKSKIESRRGERQIENWVRLAQQHIDNHAYRQARQALQNVLDLRPKESRATKLLSEMEKVERDYLKLRQDKSQYYEAAQNHWKNGEVSEALTQMGLVLELDRRAPDSSSPSSSGTYQSFYNTVRSEHEAINNAYSEARKHLTDREFGKALALCDQFLNKYPNQALFQALRFDVEEQQRQQLSAFIAEIDRRLEAESDLDAKVSLLREALAQCPGEAHFQRSLKLVTDKRDLVNSILARARVHEERGKINEALSDMEILRTIYSPYPGLQFEIDRLQKRRERHARESAKAHWIEEIDHQVGQGDYGQSLTLLGQAQAEFPNDAELVELEKVIRQHLDRANEAQQLLAQGNDFCSRGQFDDGIETFKKALKLDERSSAIHSALLEVLLERARILLPGDWRAAEALTQQALDLDPGNPLAKSLHAQALDHKRDETVAHVASQARRLQAEGNIEGAADEVAKALSSFPSDSRLVGLRDTLKRELSQLQRKNVRLTDLDELKTLRQQVESAVQTDDLKTIYERTRNVAARHEGEADFDSVAREIDRIVQARGGRAPTPKPRKTEPKPKPEPKRDHFAKLRAWIQSANWRERLRNPFVIWPGAAFFFLVAGLAVWHWLPKPVPSQPTPPVMVDVQFQTSPPGATIRINNEVRGTSNQSIQLAVGNYQVEASLDGYETVSATVAATPGSSPVVQLTLLPITQGLRIATPDLENGEVWIDDNSVGKLEGGSLNLTSLPANQHTLKIAAGNQEAKFSFDNSSGGPVKIQAPLAVKNLQLVVISTKGSDAHISSSVGSGPVTVDGNAVGVLDAGTIDVKNLQPGMHELVIGKGKDARKMTFENATAPILSAVVSTDRDVGSILVVTGQDNADVYIDGKKYSRPTLHGQVRIPNLQTRQHTIRVTKEGFEEREQQIDVVKGQEAKLDLPLKVIPKLATLQLDHFPPGTQVSLDDASLGNIGPDGTLAHADIAPGEHTLQFSLANFETRSVPRKFVAGELTRVTGTEISFDPLPGTLEVVVAPNASVVVTRGGQTVKQFTGPSKLTLEPGTYLVVSRSPNHPDSSATVAIASRESKKLALTVVTYGMEHFEGDSWAKHDQWYQRRGGGFVLYDVPRLSGTVTFSVKLHHGLFGGRSKWVANFVDDKNYVLFQMDGKYLYRTIYIDGAKHDLPKIEHNIPGNSPFVTLRIQILPSHIIHRWTQSGTDWKTINDWVLADSAPTPQKSQLTAQGRFGFFLPENDEIEISNLAYYPESSH